jgi:hypothetical protein
MLFIVGLLVLFFHCHKIRCAYIFFIIVSLIELGRLDITSTTSITLSISLRFTSLFPYKAPFSTAQCVELFLTPFAYDDASVKS